MKLVGALKLLLTLMIVISAMALIADIISVYIAPIEHEGTLSFTYSEGEAPVTRISFVFTGDIYDNIVVVDVPDVWSYDQTPAGFVLFGGQLQPGDTLTAGTSLKRYVEPGNRTFTITASTTRGETISSEGVLVIKEMIILRILYLLSLYKIPILVGTVALGLAVAYYVLRRGMVPSVPPTPGEPCTKREGDGMFCCNTGVIMRILEVVDMKHSLVFGLVRPGGSFSQHHKKTKITFHVTKGIAELEIEKQVRMLAKGESVIVNPDQKHRLMNHGKEPWYFTGKWEPPWDPDDVTYGNCGKIIPGDKIWFEIKKSIDDVTPGVKYLIDKYKPQASSYRVVLEPGVRGIIEYHEQEKHTITGVRGRGIVSVNGRHREFGPDDMLVIEPNQKVQFINPSRDIWEMRGRAEPRWDPNETFYILPGDIVVPGNDIWFEFVVPS